MAGRNKIIRTIGLDADVVVAFMLNKDNFSMSVPRMLLRRRVYVNYIVLRQAFGVLVYKKKKSREEAAKLISSFINNYGIIKIARKEVDPALVSSYFDKLKKQRDINKNYADDYDLDIIAIYKSKGIDCIVSRNTAHLQPFCKYLDIELEKLIEDLELKFRKKH